MSRGSYAIQKVRTTFAGAYGILSAAAYIRAGIITSQQNGSYLNLGHLYDTENASMLASILGITQEVRNFSILDVLGTHGTIKTVNHRRLIREVYDDRTLHRLLGVEPLRIRSHGQSDSRRAHAGSSTTTNDHRRPSSQSVQAVEEVSIMSISSDDEKHYKRREPSEEEGRYEIEGRNRPTKRRRKMGTQADPHTVFTTDEEEEVSVEEGTDQGKRRTYWPSKAG